MKSKESEFAMMNSKGIISQIFKIKNIKIQMLLQRFSKLKAAGKLGKLKAAERLAKLVTERLNKLKAAE